MERFKVCEKETKTKAFSKEGLGLMPKAVSFYSMIFSCIQSPNTISAKISALPVTGPARKSKRRLERMAKQHGECVK